MMRDRARTCTRKFVYGFFALGWRGSVRQWHHYESAYLVLAALATPLCIFGPFGRVDGFRGLSSPVGTRRSFRPTVAGDLLRVRHGTDAHGDLPHGVPPGAHHQRLHFDYMAKIMLVTGSMVGYAYARVLHRLVQGTRSRCSPS